MHIFVTGGSGQTGPAIVSELIAHGHTVTGLARSDKSTARLDGLGAKTLYGSLDDLEVLAKGASHADGVIHMAFGGDFSDPASMTKRDCAAIEAMGQALIDSGKPLVMTSGTLVMPTGKVATEQDEPDPQSLGTLRIPGEQACLGFAAQGVRAIVLRLAPTVHGAGDYGFIPFLISTARRTRCLWIHRGGCKPLARCSPPRRRNALPPCRRKSSGWRPPAWYRRECSHLRNHCTLDWSHAESARRFCSGR